MKSFELFFEDFATQKRQGNRPFGTTYDKNDDSYSIKDVDSYKQERNKKTQYKQTNAGGGVVDSIRYDTNDYLDNVMKYYGFTLKEGLDSLPTDGSLVYRGHKDPDPFAKGEDSKARDNEVYFSSNPNYTYGVYSVGLNPNSTQVGQTGFSNLQSITQEPKPNTKFNVGFFTVATPKNADDILWYFNFGYENGNEGFTRLEKNIKKINDAECIESRESFSKVRTYLMYNKHLISFERLKKVKPDLYKKVMSSYVIKTLNEPRFI